MDQMNEAGLQIVFRNPEPRRERDYPTTWLLLVGNQTLKVVVNRGTDTRPRVIYKEAA